MERERIDKGGKRIMREFRLQELSAVDRPAQVHAKLTLMKRDDNSKGDEMSKREQVTVEDLQLQLDEEITKSATASATAKEELDKANVDLEAARAEIEALKAKPSKDEEELLEGKDEKARKEFMALSKADRDKQIAARKVELEKIKKNDEVLAVEGVGEVRKSIVGEQQFAVFKVQQERFEKQEQELAAERDLRKRTQLTKVVTDEYDALPGKTVEKVEVLLAVEKMDEEARKTLNTMLAAGNKAIGAAFTTMGHNGEARKQAAGDFMKKVDEIRTTEKCGHQEAMQKARRLHPELFQVYQGEQTLN